MRVRPSDDRPDDCTGRQPGSPRAGIRARLVDLERVVSAPKRPVDWMPAEWSDDPECEAAWLDGIEGAVEWDPQTKRWAWWVRPTGDRCEWPEMFDSGSRPAKQTARLAVEGALRRADSTYGRKTEGEW
jgi:hypothetical protein